MVKEIDISISCACLEHIYDPKLAFEKLSLCTRKNGVGYHQVDHRDHRDFDRPLEFLLDRMSTENIGISFTAKHGNAWRPHEYQKLFTENGFEVLSLSPNMVAADEYLDEFMPRLHKSSSFYDKLTREECTATSVLYIIKKK